LELGSRVKVLKFLFTLLISIVFFCPIFQIYLFII